MERVESERERCGRGSVVVFGFGVFSFLFVSAMLLSCLFSCHYLCACVVFLLFLFFFVWCVSSSSVSSSSLSSLSSCYYYLSSSYYYSSLSLHSSYSFVVCSMFIGQLVATMFGCYFRVYAF